MLRLVPDNDELAPAPTQKLENKGEKAKGSDASKTKPKTESGGKTGPAP